MANRPGSSYSAGCCRRIICGLFAGSILALFCFSSPSVGQDVNEGHSIIRTYGGDLVIRFPNYDLHVVGAASRDFGVNPARRNGAPLVFRNNEGMFWDGAGAFISPNYPYHLVTKDRFALLPINQTDPEAPFESGIPWPSEPTPPVGSIHVPVIPYRPPSDGDVILKMAERKTQGMLRMSRLPGDVPTNSVKPKLGVPTSTAITRPTATIIVRPLTPQTNPPPVHDSLGLFQQK